MADDPFVFDEDFVRGAAISEASADERAKAAKKQAKRSGQKRKQKRKHPVRNSFVLVLVIGVAVAIGFGRTGTGPLSSIAAAPLIGTTLPVSTTSTTSAAAASPSGTLAPTTTTSRPVAGTTPDTGAHLQYRNFLAGDCVRFDLGRIDEVGATLPTDVVDCAEPHVIEIVSKRDVADLTEPFPSLERWSALADERCTADVTAALGGVLDTEGRLEVGTIHASVESWSKGDRTLWCGIAARRIDDSLPYKESGWQLFTGIAAGQPQGIVWPAGSCLMHLALSTPCSAAHHLEVTGTIDLTGNVIALPPPEDHMGWAQMIDAACDAFALSYLGHDPAFGYYAGWLPIAAESWNAGQHVAHCIVAFETPEASTWTGSLATQ